MTEAERIENLMAKATVHEMAGGVYFAELPGLFGVWGHGATEEECLEELRVALQSLLDASDGE
jgi:predicted RNase H-like HicB family nuclease